MSEIVIATGTVRNRGQAIEVLTRAFEDDPAVRWIFADEWVYQCHFPTFVYALAGRAFAHGTADQPLGSAGAALWLPDGVHADGKAVARVIETAVPEERREAVFQLMDAIADAHPEEPHWYLPLIGVDPAHHGLGVGAGLMRAGLDRCDRDGLPAYLEASSEASRRLYERLGFVSVGTIRAAGAPPLFPMWREPQARSGGISVAAWPAARRASVIEGSRFRHLGDGEPA